MTRTKDFARVLRAEWTKLRTVRGWVLGLAGAALATVVVGLLGTAASGGSGPRGDRTGFPTGPGGEAVNDSFYFVHRTLEGDGSITVPVASLTGLADDGRGGTGAGSAQPWAKAGVIVKKDLTQGSPYAAVVLTGGHGVRMQYDYTHDRAAPAAAGQAPRWLRLVREGDVLTGYVSADGARWHQVGTARPSGLGRTVRAGLFAASPQARQETPAGTGFVPAVATGTFGRPVLRGAWPDSGWSGTQVGGDAGTSGSYGNGTKGGFTQSGGTLAVTGAGDIAPVVGGPAMGPAYSPENFLVGGFAGLVVVIAVSAVFVTGEYRCGLIRTTLTAHPARGRLLTAKAVTVGGAAFAAGLVAAALVVPLGERSAEDRGFRVFPVDTATEARVVLGTALLFAATAVLALSLGALLRRGAAAVAVAVAAMVVPYLLATSAVLPAGASEWLLRVTPAAGFAVQQTLPRYAQVLSVYEPSTGYHPLPPWAGFAVLCGYVVPAFGLALTRLRRRDA
ncbi:hypothetical protein ACI2LJ_01070 [Streptomyces sp. NPDC088090]|uniref:hypothetical protein n=1 Tax=Streptomyces sp. NPDC088090 TaxID=3365822 RepID=UPI00384AE6AD